MPVPTHMLMELMVAQKENLARLIPGTVLEGTTSEGDPITLRSPTPELIRIMGTMLQSQQKAVRAEQPYERILTIAPVRMANAGKIANRRDEIATYLIHGAVILTKAEEQADADTQYENDPLAHKLMTLLNDVENLVLDDFNLGGLVQDITGTESTFAIDYPVATFSLQVTSLISGCRR